MIKYEEIVFDFLHVQNIRKCGKCDINKVVQLNMLEPKEHTDCTQYVSILNIFNM